MLLANATTWFTADLHLGHERIIDLCARPFSSAADMNRALITNWNQRVEEHDTVWVLGDVALGPIEHSLALVRELNGHKILVAGNHDRCFPGYWDGKNQDRSGEWVQRYLDAGFASVTTGTNPLRHVLRPAFGSEGNTEKVLLSHFPRTGESGDRSDRFTNYRPRPAARRGAVDPWVIHGHVHNEWTLHQRQINVGVDVWDYTPVPAATLIRIIQDGMPPCECAGEQHAMGAPKCVINGGPAWAN